MRRGILAVAIAVFTALAVVGPASADGTRYTQGDAEAMLHSFPPGGMVFQRLEGAEGLDVRPFEFYGDFEYCVDDWHLLALAWFDWEHEVPELGIYHLREDVDALLSSLSMQFVLDEQEVEATSAGIKVLQADDAQRESEELFLEEFVYGADVILGKGWGVQYGRTLAPGDLSVGEHDFAVTVTLNPGEPTEWEAFFDVTFTVYGSDSPACTG